MTADPALCVGLGIIALIVAFIAGAEVSWRYMVKTMRRKGAEGENDEN